MRPSTIPVSATLATILLLAGTAAASAATAYASTEVNVRAGAGTAYPVVDVLHEGERVEVDYCKGAWCAIEKPGPDGWVNANYLEAERSHSDRDDDEYDSEDDDSDFYLIYPGSHAQFWPYYRSRSCIGGPNARFCIAD